MRFGREATRLARRRSRDEPRAPPLMSARERPYAGAMESDLDFYTRRAAEERKAARLALGEATRHMHERLADEYALKVKQLRGAR